MTTSSAPAGFSFPVRYSPAEEPAAIRIATLLEPAVDYISKLLAFRPDLVLAVVPPRPPAEFDLPRATAEGEIIALSGPGAVLAELAALAEPNLQRGVDADFDPDALNDLLAVREVARLCCLQRPVTFRRRWLAEFFADLCLHTWVAETAPASMPVLEALPSRVASIPAEHWPHHTLAAFEEHTALHPANYGWYRCRLIVAARRMYEAEGFCNVRRLFDAFASADATDCDDAALADLLYEIAGDAGTAVLTRWDEIE